MNSISGTNDIWGVNSAKNVNAVYEDSKTDIGVEDFLQLMIAEIQNMDFMSSETSDSSAYVTQLAQITTMQQMEQLAYYSKTNYVMGLVGKEVTVADYSLGGNVTTDVGIVEKISLSGEDLQVYVNGKAYSTSKIMSVNNPEATQAEEMEKVTKMTPYLLKRNADSAVVSWNLPECDDPSKYFFNVYYSEEEDFDSGAQVKQGILVESVQGDEDLIAELEDLEPGTTYYVNIIISTNEGNDQVYQKLIFETKDE